MLRISVDSFNSDQHTPVLHSPYCDNGVPNIVHLNMTNFLRVVCPFDLALS